MIRKSQIFLKQLIGLLDAGAVLAAFVIAYVVRDEFRRFYTLDLVRGQEVFEPLVPFTQYASLLLLILPVWLASIHAVGGYRHLRTRTIGAILWKLAKAQGLGFLILACAVVVLRLHFVSRSFLAVFVVLSWALLVAGRILTIAAFRWMARRGYFRYRLLIVGTGPRARRFMELERRHAADSMEIIGWIDQSPELVGRQIHGVPVLGTLEQLPHVLSTTVVDEVAFVVPRSWLTHVESAILQCELLGIRATVAADLFNVQFARATMVEVEGMPLLSFESTPHHQWGMFCKRLLDLLAAVIGLVLALPVMLVTAGLIKASSRGPVFFRQQRVGLNGRLFTLYKFRTMAGDAEQRQAELQARNEMDGPVFKLTNDPRVTRIGRWLRRFSIDEIPQFWNVLRGEMSLVGPRPPLPSEVQHYEPWQRRRLSMRPGLTCLWQVSGRNQVPFQRWMELDLQYIDRWSFGLDMRILAQTLFVVLTAKGAK